MEKRIIELYRRKFDDIRHEEDGRNKNLSL